MHSMQKFPRCRWTFIGGTSSRLGSWENSEAPTPEALCVRQRELGRTLSELLTNCRLWVGRKAHVFVGAVTGETGAKPLVYPAIRPVAEFLHVRCCGLAQPRSAPVLRAGCRRFECCPPDHPQHHRCPLTAGSVCLGNRCIRKGQLLRATGGKDQAVDGQALGGGDALPGRRDGRRRVKREGAPFLEIEARVKTALNPVL